MYLLDSCICIDFLRGRLPYAYDLMRNSDPRLFKIPAIVEGELLVGVEKIGHNDLFIAATALANNAVLVTNNMDEFKRVPGLSLECWYEMKWEG